MTEQHHDDAPPETTGPELESGKERWFDETWTKVHPLSPLVRGWVTIVAIPVAFFTYNWQMWMDLWEVWRSGELMQNLGQNPLPYIIGAGSFLVLALLIFVGFTLSWWFTRYKITEEHVMVKSGIFMRQHRQARIDRVQAVDLRQPLLARLTKLAELRFEVAEGDGTAATLAFLKKPHAEQLRTEIMDRAAGRTPSPSSGGDAHEPTDQAVSGQFASDGGGDPVTTASPRSASTSEDGQPSAAAGSPASADFSDRLIARVPVGRLIGSVLLGVGTVVFLVLVLIVLFITGTIAVITATTSERELSDTLGEINLPLMLPILIGGIVSYYGQFSSGFRFTAAMTGSGLRLRYGLLETTTQTVPPGRVQAIQIQSPLLWRPFGWHKVVVTVAGYGVDSRTTLLPVGKVEDVMAVTAEMFPDLRIENPEQMFIEGLRGRGTALGFSEVPARAGIFDPLVRRRRGSFSTPAAVMIRDGRVTRLLTMVPHERIQSAALEQGPFGRLRRIATLMLHLPAGPITARIKNQDLQTVKELFDQEAAEAAVARRLTDRNQWMLPEELDEFEKMVENIKNDDAGAAQDEGTQAAGDQGPGGEEGPPRDHGSVGGVGGAGAAAPAGGMEPAEDRARAGYVAPAGGGASAGEAGPPGHVAPSRDAGSADGSAAAGRAAGAGTRGHRAAD